MPPDQSYEQRLLAGIELIRNGALSIRATAKKLGVSHETLRRRCQGASSRKRFHAQLMALTPAQELHIENLIFLFISYGNMLTSTFLCNLANEFRLGFALAANKPPPKALGISWTAGFRRRHKKVSQIMAASMSRDLPGDHATSNSNTLSPPLFKFNHTDSETCYSQWIAQISLAFAQYHISSKHIYNLAELGFAVDRKLRPAKKSTSILFDATSSIQCISRNDLLKSSKPPAIFASSIECVSTDGSFLPPYYSCHPSQQSNNNSSSSPDGWSTADSMYSWLTSIFHPETLKSLPDNQYRVILLNSNSRLFSCKVLEFALTNRILFALLPSQVSESPLPFAPIDVAIAAIKPSVQKFSAFSRSLTPTNEATTERVWEHFTDIVASARNEAFLQNELVSAWNASGVLQAEQTESTPTNSNLTKVSKTIVTTPVDSKPSSDIKSPVTLKLESPQISQGIPEDRPLKIPQETPQDLIPKISQDIPQNLSPDLTYSELQNLTLPASQPSPTLFNFHSGSSSPLFSDYRPYIDLQKPDPLLSFSSPFLATSDHAPKQAPGLASFVHPLDTTHLALSPFEFGLDRSSVRGTRLHGVPQTHNVPQTQSMPPLSPTLSPTQVQSQLPFPVDHLCPSDSSVASIQTSSPDLSSGSPTVADPLAIDPRALFTNIKAHLCQHLSSRPPLFYADGSSANLDDAQKTVWLLQEALDSYL